MQVARLVVELWRCSAAVELARVRTAEVMTASIFCRPCVEVPDATVVEPQTRLTGHAALLEKVLLELDCVKNPLITVLVSPLDE